MAAAPPPGFIPPPPPPVPLRQGPPGGGVGGGGGPQIINLRPGQAPPHPANRPPPPAHMQLPGKQQVMSTRVVDITPRRPMDDDAARKRLTTYEAHTIRKIIPRDSKEKATWAKAEITKEQLSQEDLVKEVKKLSLSKRSVQEKKSELMPFQQGQVTRLLDELTTAENDHNFELSLSQLDRQEIRNRKNQRETTTITVYVKRSPLKELNPVGLFNALENMKRERLAQLNRPPQQQAPQQAPQQPSNIINLGQGEKGGPRKGSVPKHPGDKKHRHDDSSVSSGYSDSDSGSDYSSSENTSFSSSSGRRSSKKYIHKSRSRSRRPREHRKKYYIDDRGHSPEPPRHRDPMPYGGISSPRYVPEVPRVVPAVPAFDPVTAAYQAGKIDADAERFGLPDRYPPLRHSVAEPRAIVTYGRMEPRFERHFSEPRYEERFVDDLREEDYLRREERRRRDAEDYMDRRASESRVEPRIIYKNPFAPIPRYATSHSSAERGW